MVVKTSSRRLIAIKHWNPINEPEPPWAIVYNKCRKSIEPLSLYKGSGDITNTTWGEFEKELLLDSL
jgi:hypothetical protein